MERYVFVKQIVGEIQFFEAAEHGEVSGEFFDTVAVERKFPESGETIEQM